MHIIIKNITFIAAGLLLAAHKPSSDSGCGPYRPFMKRGCEIYIGKGALAADQNLGNYISMGTVPYSCQESTCVCTYYLDPTDGKIKQCEQGTIVF